jgi:preprotein translocase subunit SecA
MIQKLLKKIIGTRNDRLLKQFRKTVLKINALEPSYAQMSDAQLKEKTQNFKARLAAGEVLNDLLPEAFAVVREASKRTLNMRHFDVQLIGGMVLHQGKIAEMRTGEGKTLAATLPAYLNALTEKAVHIVTVNDYLARRDAEWMEPIYNFLGMTVGVNVGGISHEQKHRAYDADVVYGTNNEFGFDYLRDNMVYENTQKVQRDLTFAIVDEVDSILIDEARTPLIISGQGQSSSELYCKMDQLIPLLKRQMVEEDPKGEKKISDEEKGDYFIDEKNKQTYLTDLGYQHVEKLMKDKGLLKQNTNLYDPENILLMHYVNAALRAHTSFHRDIDYIVKDNKVVIVDEHTGRLMEGRRWSEGLHQAVEAKENVSIELENQTLATITLQNYFRLYEKLSGMTGTADTEAFEFQKIYNLEVVVIPTNAPMIRQDCSDKIYLTMDEKIDAILKDVNVRIEKKQPVLVGTASIEMSELLSKVFTKARIKHQVLNAKQHEREAKIIAQAGRPGAVTIATNMAGRGTDIVLGGNIEAEFAEAKNLSDAQKEKKQHEWKSQRQAVLKAGGLHVLGSERHESRRIDNQLRGRCGRQGDAGSSQFYLSMEDNLLRIFGAERMMNTIRKLGLKQGESIEHSWINRSIANAQCRVEGLNFDVRKQLLEFDDAANDQRKVIYRQRDILLKKEKISDIVLRYFEESLPHKMSQYIPPQTLEEEWDIAGLEKMIEQDFQQKLLIAQWLEEDARLDSESLMNRIIQCLRQAYERKRKQFDPDTINHVEKMLMLQLLDTAWREHLASMEHMRQGIYLRSYAQKNPTQEFKREAFSLFTRMLGKLKYDLISALSRIHVDTSSQGGEDLAIEQPKNDQLHYQHVEQVNLLQSISHQDNPADQISVQSGRQDSTQHEPYVRERRKIGRNEPCLCGSGKKYKQCCGKIN